MELPANLLKTLTEIGLAAGGYGLKAEAERIFTAVQLLRPESDTAYIGLAVAQLGAGQYDQAATILRDQALKTQPDSSLAKSFLGLALKQAGRNAEADKVLNEVVAANDHPQAVALAQTLLNPA